MPKPSIPIILGGKTRHLRYAFSSLIALEDALGVPLSDIGEVFPRLDSEGEMVGSLSAKKIQTLIWAGLLHEDKELTQEQVGDMLDEEDDLLAVINKLTDAFMAAFPDEEDAAKNSQSQAKVKEKP